VPRRPAHLRWPCGDGVAVGTVWGIPSHVSRTVRFREDGAVTTDVARDVDEVESRPTTAPDLALIADEDDIVRVVCCREPVWDRGFCGAEADYINLAATVVCSMCVEVSEQRLPGFLENDPPICPNDEQPCPDDKVDLRILREVTRRGSGCCADAPSKVAPR
jgi:hypothetical protein